MNWHRIIGWIIAGLLFIGIDIALAYSFVNGLNWTWARALSTIFVIDIGTAILATIVCFITWLITYDKENKQ